MITDDYQLMFEDYATGDMLTLGGDQQFCSVRFDGIGSAELITSERANNAEDGITFGYEYLGKRTWTINGGIKAGSLTSAGDSGDAWDYLSQLMRAWDYNVARGVPRAVVPLYMRRPGRDTVVIYGRPDRIDPDVTQSYAGWVTYQASFRQSDPKFYSNDEQSLAITASQPYVGGILLNEDMDAFLAPLTTTATTFAEGFITQGGDIASPVTISITGECTNPKVQLFTTGDELIWELRLAALIESDQTVTIDPNIWARSVLRNDGASLAGALFGNRLAQVAIPPGTYKFVYTASSSGGSSECEIRVRNAWAEV